VLLTWSSKSPRNNNRIIDQGLPFEPKGRP
jgi:hypothetical protein